MDSSIPNNQYNQETPSFNYIQQYNRIQRMLNKRAIFIPTRSQAIKTKIRNKRNGR